MPHLLLLAAIALIAIGPKQLPEVARVIGRFLNDLKKVRDEFTRTIVEHRDNVNQNINQNVYDQTQHQQDYGTHESTHVPAHTADVTTSSFDQNHPHHTGYDGATTSDHSSAESSDQTAVDEKDQLAFDLNKKDS